VITHIVLLICAIGLGHADCDVPNAEQFEVLDVAPMPKEECMIRAEQLMAAKAGGIQSGDYLKVLCR
jgi:hypothetical protein